MLHSDASYRTAMLQENRVVNTIGKSQYAGNELSYHRLQTRLRLSDFQTPTTAANREPRKLPTILARLIGRHVR